jgi:hypothetical protein
MAFLNSTSFSRQPHTKAPNLRKLCNFENVNLGTERGTVLVVIIFDNRAGKYKDNGGKTPTPKPTRRPAGHNSPFGSDARWQANLH